MVSNQFVRALVVCTAGLFGAAFASAQTPVKVAVINLQRAIVETAEIKKAQVELEARYKPRTAEMEQLQNELRDIQTQIQSGKLSPQGEQEANARGQLRQRQLKRVQEDLQGDVDRDRNEILQKAGQRMSDVVKKLADERGLDMVVDITNTVFFRPALEITNEAIAAYDKAYPPAAAK